MITIPPVEPEAFGGWSLKDPDRNRPKNREPRALAPPPSQAPQHEEKETPEISGAAFPAIHWERANRRAGIIDKAPISGGALLPYAYLWPSADSNEYTAVRKGRQDTTTMV